MSDSRNSTSSTTPTGNHESSCGCIFEAGHWGDSGWHYYELTEALFIQQQMQRYFGSLIGSLHHTQAEEDRARANAKAMAHSYVGQPVAYEPCQPYRDAIKAKIAAQRGEENARSSRLKTFA